MQRWRISELTFDDARKLANEHDMDLVNPSLGVFQLRHKTDDWIIGLYPRRNGLSPLCKHDRNRPGPYLNLPENWTLLDAVKAAIVAKHGTLVMGVQ